MELLPIEEINVNQAKINKIDHLVKSIYRLIIYSRHHLDDDLLDTYLLGMHKLQELLSLKNANRVTRVAKNWMLMYDLYPPIFIKDPPQKKEYIATLSNSFKQLDKTPRKWNQYTENFFEQELDRIVVNATLLYETVNKIGLEREVKTNIKHS